MRAIGAALAAVIVCGCANQQTAEEDFKPKIRPKAMELQAADGVKIYAERYLPTEASRHCVLLFHQAGSNAAEYRLIGPELAERGVECLAIDQRTGGTKFGRDNETMKGTGRSDWKYRDAYPDMQAAYNWARSRGFGKIVVWGSSYSASLVLKLGAEMKANAVVAFSPGEYFDEKTVVSEWNANLKVPTFMAFTEDEARQGGYALQQTAPKTIERSKDVVAVFEGGVHGSSTLLKSEAPTAYAGYWNKLWEFFESQKISKPVVTP